MKIVKLIERLILSVVAVIGPVLLFANTITGPFAISSIATSAATSCSASDGSISLTVDASNAGVAPYDISIDNGATWLINNQTPVSNVLSAPTVQWGTYPIAVRDANGDIIYPGYAQISGCTLNVPEGKDSEFSTSSAPGATGYIWTSTIGSITAGQNTLTASYSFLGEAHNASGTICVQPTGPTCTAPPTCIDVVVIASETDCGDRIDEDGDGNMDCLDSDCDCIIEEICTDADPFLARTYNIWHTGSGGGLDFNQLQTSGPLTGYPSTFADLGVSSNMPQQEGGATFCNPRTGDVILYSDGMVAWDENGVEFSTPDPSNRFNTLSTNLSSAAGTPLIVSAPGQCNAAEELYIFFTDDHLGATPELYYVVVNVSAKTIGLPIQLTSYDMSEQISAVQVSCDTTWIVYRNALDMEAIRWTTVGFEAPVITSNIHTDTDQRYAASLSLDGTKYVTSAGAAGFDDLGKYSVANFNIRTGKFFNDFQVNAIPYLQTGSNLSKTNDAIYSPDGSKLYVSLDYGRGGVQYDALIQFDMLAGSPAAVDASGVLIASVLESTGGIGGMMNAPDGRIYVSTGDGSKDGTNAIHVIDFPNLAGAACTFKQDLIAPGGLVTSALNNMVFGMGPNSCVPSISATSGPNVCQDIAIEVQNCYLGDGGPYEVNYKYDGVWTSMPGQVLNSDNELILTGLSIGSYDSISILDGVSCGSNYLSFELNDPSCIEICNDGLDNDGDNLIDCADDDCPNAAPVSQVSH